MGIQAIVMLVVGCFTAIAGVGIILYREAVAERNRKNVEARFGRLFPGLAEKISTPGKLIPAGIVGAVVGAILVWRALAG